MSRTTHRRSLALILVAMVSISCSDAVTAPPSAPHAARDVAKVSVAPSSPEWQEQARTQIAANSLNALAAARVLAALSVAQYLAVVDADDHFDAEGALPGNGIGTGGRQLVEARRGAVAGASAEVLSFFFPAAAQSFLMRVEAEAGEGPGGVHPHFDRGLEAGRAAGATLVERARNDNFTVPWTGTVPVGPGRWVAAATGTPIGATFGGVTPYLLESREQFRPPPPPAFLSPAFMTDMDEIRALTANRTTAQADSGRAWNYGAGTYTPMGFWNEKAATYIAERTLDERAATHTFALTHAAVMDAMIGCWEAKYHYWLLRPYQVPPAVSLSLGAPNHPSYPSGHSCGSAAAGTVLAHVFPEHAAELHALVIAAGRSRMYTGIHFRFDVTAGQELGANTAAWAIAADQSQGLLSAMR